MRFMGALAVAAIVVIAAGCDGDTGAGEITTTTERAASTTSAPDVTPTTTAPPPSTTQATSPTTETSTSPTTQPTTTPAIATSSTTTDGAANMLAVVDAVEAAWQASVDAVRDPLDDEKLARLDDHFTGVLLEGWQSIVAGYRENNYREIENPDEPDSFEIELASVAVNQAGTFSTVQGCSITSGIIVEVGGNPDGSDRVIEDGVGRTVVEFDVVSEGGVWKVADVRSPDQEQRIASCN